MNKILTIVIPCKNEKKGIIDVISHIEPEYKVIIADSSDDETKELIQGLKLTRKHIKIVDGGFPSVARNNGAKSVKTPYILFLDADIYLKDKTIISTALEEIQKNDLDLVTIKFTTFEKNYRYVYKLLKPIQYLSSKTNPFALGGFMLFKTEKFKELGGFNPLDKICEDYRLSMKIKPKKFKVINKTAFTYARRFQKKRNYLLL